MMLPPPDAAAGLVGWLAFTNALAETRYTPLLPLRKGRLLRLPNPLAWATSTARRQRRPEFIRHTSTRSLSRR